MTRQAYSSSAGEPAAQRTLFALLGVPWKLTPKSWLFVPTRIGFCVVLALVFFQAEDIGTRIVYGLLAAPLLVLTQFLHIVGHTLGGRLVGAPMTAALIVDTKIWTVYADEARAVPSRAHLGRALGGPLANLVVGLLALAVWALVSSPPVLVFAVMNLALGFGIMLPIPGVDGEVIWRELRR